MTELKSQAYRAATKSETRPSVFAVLAVVALLVVGCSVGPESCPRQERHHESHASREETMQYLVQMKLADSVRPRSPEEAIGFIEQYVFPTLDVSDKLLEEKKIAAGGPVGGAIALALVVRAESIQELDDVLESLPIWPLMQTTVIPLTSFEGRRVAGRRRLEGEVRRAGGQ